MKYGKGLIFGLILSALVSNVWALKTKFDPKIYEKELIAMQIVTAKQLRTGLGVTDDKQAMVIRHVVTTGRNRANQNSILLDIKTLEQIRPRVHAIAMMKNQTALSNAQVKSLAIMLQRHHTKLPTWLLNNNQKKYINIALQKENDRDGNLIPVNNQNALKLIAWALKSREIVNVDHPA